MSQLEMAILRESQSLREMLPSLLHSHAGRWVVFRDHSVVSTHATEGEAFEAGVSKFGTDGGFVVARIAKSTPTPIHSAAAFGLTRT